MCDRLSISLLIDNETCVSEIVWFLLYQLSNLQKASTAQCFHVSGYFDLQNVYGLFFFSFKIFWLVFCFFAHIIQILVIRNLEVSCRTIRLTRCETSNRIRRHDIYEGRE